VDAVPLIGDQVREPFDRMSAAGLSLADAGRGQQEVVDKLAIFLPLALAFLAIALLAAVWLPLRIRFISRATAAQRYLVAADDVDLFALRALARQPLTQLVAIDPNPAGAPSGTISACNLTATQIHSAHHTTNQMSETTCRVLRLGVSA
jgi:hypothetical protein